MVETLVSGNMFWSIVGLLELNAGKGRKSMEKDSKLKMDGLDDSSAYIWELGSQNAMIEDEYMVNVC